MRIYDVNRSLPRRRRWENHQFYQNTQNKVSVLLHVPVKNRSTNNGNIRSSYFRCELTASLAQKRIPALWALRNQSSTRTIACTETAHLEKKHAPVLPYQWNLFIFSDEKRFYLHVPDLLACFRGDRRLGLGVFPK